MHQTTMKQFCKGEISKTQVDPDQLQSHKDCEGWKNIQQQQQQKNIIRQ